MIDRGIRIPYYIQLVDIIERQITSEVLKEEEQLPSEFELGSIYRVNRHTVRQAISELCQRGMLYRVRGRGTFVAKRLLDCLEYKISTKNRFTETVLQAGRIPGNRVLHTAEMLAPDNVAAALGLFKGEHVYLAEILRLVDNKPFLLASAYVPVKYFPKFLDKIAGFYSFFAIYQEHYGIRPERVKSIFHATFPSQHEAMALQIPINMPVLKAVNILKSQDNVLIQYGTACYCGDVAKISVDW